MSDESAQDNMRRRLDAESKRLIQSVDELRALEQKKREEPISTPGFHELADAIVTKARDVFRMTTIEEELGDRVDTGEVTLNEVDGNNSPDETLPISR